MLLPSQYITKAVRGIQSRLMRDCACVMSHGDEKGPATRVGNPAPGEFGTTAGGPADTCHAVAAAEDFPCVLRGETVTLDEELPRYVVGVSKDPSSSFLKLRLSSPLEGVVFHAGGHEFTALCAVMDNRSIAGIGVSTHSVTGDEVVMFVPRDEWHCQRDPEFGMKCILKDGRRATVQAVEHCEYGIKLSAVSTMRVGGVEQ